MTPLPPHTRPAPDRFAPRDVSEHILAARRTLAAALTDPALTSLEAYDVSAACGVLDELAGPDPDLYTGDVPRPGAAADDALRTVFGDLTAALDDTAHPLGLREKLRMADAAVHIHHLLNVRAAVTADHPEPGPAGNRYRRTTRPGRPKHPRDRP